MQALKRPCEERLRHCALVVLLLFDRQELRLHLRAMMGEGAGGATAAVAHVRVEGAEAGLLRPHA